MAGLKELVLRLREGDVEFVLIGGFGAIARGSSMMVTRVVEVACSVAPANLGRLFAAFESLHPVHRMTPQKLPFTREQAERGGLRNLYLSTDWGQLDCLGEVKGIGDYAACVAHSSPLEIDGVAVPVLTIEALIEAKRATGRPRDLHAVLELEAIRERRRG